MGFGSEVVHNQPGDRLPGLQTILCSRGFMRETKTVELFLSGFV